MIWTFVQARLGSTRLPRKVLKDLHGESILERVMRKADAIGFPVALLIPETDKELAGLALAKEWVYLEGPEDDVLRRFAMGVEAFKPDHVVRVTADCPFLDPWCAKWAVDDHLRSGADLTWDQAEGRGVQVFRAEALLEADEKATARWHREHPDEWLLARQRYNVVTYSVDTEEDLVRARRRAQ